MSAEFVRHRNGAVGLVQRVCPDRVDVVELIDGEFAPGAWNHALFRQPTAWRQSSCTPVALPRRDQLELFAG